MGTAGNDICNAALMKIAEAQGDAADIYAALKELRQAAWREGREVALEEAANAAEQTQTLDWRGGDEWAAGYVDGKNAAMQNVLALKHV